MAMIEPAGFARLDGFDSAEPLTRERRAEEARRNRREA